MLICKEELGPRFLRVDVKVWALESSARETLEEDGFDLISALCPTLSDLQNES